MAGKILVVDDEPAIREMIGFALSRAGFSYVEAADAAQAEVTILREIPDLILLDWMLPGQFEAFAHRKAFCERQVRDGIDAGATQILVLGAGYDTLGWRQPDRLFLYPCRYGWPA